MANGKKVRDYVTPDDSTAIVDYLIDFFNRPDVPELYSEQVAGIPVKEVHDRYEGKVPHATGSYERVVQRASIAPLDDKEKKEVSNKVIDRWIEIEANKAKYDLRNPDSNMYFKKGKNLSYNKDNPHLVREDLHVKRTPRNVVYHEAFGHALIDALYGYQEKPHFTRTESFPYMVQVYSNLAKMDRLGIPKDNRYYKRTLKAFNELRRITRNELKLEGD